MRSTSTFPFDLSATRLRPVDFFSCRSEVASSTRDQNGCPHSRISDLERALAALKQWPLPAPGKNNATLWSHYLRDWVGKLKSAMDCQLWTDRTAPPEDFKSRSAYWHSGTLCFLSSGTFSLFGFSIGIALGFSTLCLLGGESIQQSFCSRLHGSLRLQGEMIANFGITNPQYGSCKAPLKNNNHLTRACTQMV